MGVVRYCYYDNQMSSLGGINDTDIPGEAEGKPTIDMLDTQLFLPSSYTF